MVATVPVCHFYKVGNCRAGDGCQYAHPANFEVTRSRDNSRHRETTPNRGGGLSERHTKAPKGNRFIYATVENRQNSFDVLGIYSTLEAANKEVKEIYSKNAISGAEGKDTKGKDEDGRAWISLKGFKVTIKKWMVDKAIIERERLASSSVKSQKKAEPADEGGEDTKTDEELMDVAEESWEAEKQQRKAKTEGKVAEKTPAPLDDDGYDIDLDATANDM